MYVVGGAGILHINHSKISYQEWNLMLLMPNDECNFEIAKPTEFVQVKFSRKYVNDSSWNDVKSIECVLYHASHVVGCVFKNKPDEPIVKYIALALIHEIANNDVYSKDSILHFANR